LVALVDEDEATDVVELDGSELVLDVVELVVDIAEVTGEEADELEMELTAPALVVVVPVITPAY
jgi:hypothetical protein